MTDRRPSTRDAEFESFVRRRRAALLRIATALTGGDAHAAEDLVQRTLVRLYCAWPRARRTQLDAYARRALVHALIDERRRPVSRRERPWSEVPEPPPVALDHRPALDDELLCALRALPPRMRATVVLRHVEALTVEETAEALGCSTGTVKSQTARGLDKLRAHLAADRPTALTHPITPGERA